jgi:hypothetical protein
MDISELKSALGDEKFAALQTFVGDLVGQRDAARNESIAGRKGLQAKVSAAEAAQKLMLEKLGLSSVDELDTLPDVKGMADAAKQLEARIKRAERERDDAKAIALDATGKYRNSLQKAVVADALGNHDFVARDIVETYVSQRLTWEGDELFFKSDDGKLIPPKDGVAGIAKTRPELLKATGAGGAGVRQGNAGGGTGAKTMPRAEFEALPPAQRVEQAKAGITLT